MQTAVIVSGALRYLPEASSSWNFDADYFLCVDSLMYEPQDSIHTGNAYREFIRSLENSKVHFKSASIVDFQPDEITIQNTAVKMAWKWKMSYNMFSQYHELNEYKSVILMRPDLYVTFPGFKNLIVEENTIHTNTKPHIDEYNKGWVNDTFAVMTPNTFQKLSKFYNYLDSKYREIEKEQVHIVPNIHNHLFDFYSQNYIEIKPNLHNLETTPIRSNCLDLFNENYYLKPNLRVSDLQKRSFEWWSNKWKK